ncbi:MAG: hypothetical protein WBA39_03615, partial [Rivularia sp. (in: cyanobacteria)]
LIARAFTSNFLIQILTVIQFSVKKFVLRVLSLIQDFISCYQHSIHLSNLTRIYKLIVEKNVYWGRFSGIIIL